MPQNRTLSAKQRRAVEGLVTIGTVSGAAAHAGCSRDSVYRWLRDDPHFVEFVRQTEVEAVAAIARRLTTIGQTAVDTLDHAMRDRDAPQGVRVRAASTVLSNVLRVRELAVVEARLLALEATDAFENSL